MSELKQQIADVRRWLDAIESKADRGALPEMCDARLLAKYAAHLESMIWAEHLAALRKCPERTQAEDRAAQRYVTDPENERDARHEQTPDERSNEPYDPQNHRE